MLLNDTSSRGKWPLGQVVKTFPDRYGNVRSLLLNTINESLKRPTCKLCPIVLVERTFDSSKSCISVCRSNSAFVMLCLYIIV